MKIITNRYKDETGLSAYKHNIFGKRIHNQDYINWLEKQCTIPSVMLRLTQEEKELMIEGIESAVAICDWDNYNKEEYENPKAQISWYYSLITKLNEA